MTITVKFFALGRELVGAGSVEIALESGKTVRDLTEILREQFPNFRRLPSFVSAVNAEFADEQTVLSDGDEVAIIPPVSGG